jgi:hypothetical protein
MGVIEYVSTLRGFTSVWSVMTSTAPNDPGGTVSGKVSGGKPRRRRSWHRAAALLGTVTFLTVATTSGPAAALLATMAPTTVHARGLAVLRVGSWHGVKGNYASIQAAVDAAKPGDWVLVGPGDYHERADSTTYKPKPSGGEAGAGVWIDKANLHLRGMNRNSVVVDGTKPGSPQCSAAPADQVFGPLNNAGKPLGRNGVEVWKADAGSVENLTVCNFLTGSGGSGNEIWWNGGDGSGKVGGRGFLGAYLNATSSYYAGESTAAAYGIFSSNWTGGTWDQTYTSNFNDSGYYIGACQQVCDQVMNHAWAQYSALGYSGSNSGGSMLIENSQFDHNRDGFDTNSQNGDDPSPQNGACPGNGISPITHTHSCWVFRNNYVHDNNNPNVPTAGAAAAGPVGTGMSLSGGRNDTIMNNRFENNGAWGVIFVPYPDSGPPCIGGTLTPAFCLYEESGDALLNNTFKGNGTFGNPTNGDFAETTLEPGPSNCFRGNTEAGGGAVTSSPPTLQVTTTTCGGTVPPDANPQFSAEVLCDSQAISVGPVPGSSTCLPTDHYPRRTNVVMHPLPAGLVTMPNPCAGVPNNPWCSRGSDTSARGQRPSSGLPSTGLPIGVPLAGLLVLGTGVGLLIRRSRAA